MSFISLFLDRKFRDFNFSELTDPYMKPGGGPTQLALIRLVYSARIGDVGAGSEFTDAVYSTLRDESFRCFQEVHGPRSIGYRDWFYAKLSQFLEILVYEQLSVDGIGADGQLRTPRTDKPWEEGVLVLGPGGPPVQPSDIEQTFSPADNEPGFWGQIVDEVCRASGSRLAALEGIMARLRRKRGAVTSADAATSIPVSAQPRREWERNKKRNQIIRDLLKQGKDGLEVCAALDTARCAVLPILRRHGVEDWVTGWKDVELRRNIQQLFSKQRGKL